MKLCTGHVFVFVLLLLVSVSFGQDKGMLDIYRQTSSYFETNSYLVFDTKTKDAALVDVAEHVDSLVAMIHEKDLTLKYVFITHCHPDHLFGLAALKKTFPEAKVCFSVEEYEDMLNSYSKWQEKYPEVIIKLLKSNVDAYRIYAMDYTEIGKPDIWVSNNDTLKLGDFTFRTILTPGHARGSICYHSGDVLFSGDELFYRGVGNTQKHPTSSFEDQVKSVRRLYTLLSDDTMVFPGHGIMTTIGDEKQSNSHITLTLAIQ